MATLTRVPRALLILLVTSVAGALLLGAAAHGRPAPARVGPGLRGGVIDVASLPRVGSPDIDWLAGRTLHTRAGRAITVKVPASHGGGLQLLGRARRGWVVIDTKSSTILNVTRDGRARRVVSYDENIGPDPTFTLSSDGRLIAEDETDEGDADHLTVYNLHGNVVERHTFQEGGKVVAFPVDTLWFSSQGVTDLDGPLLTWEKGQQPIARAAKAVDIADVDEGIVMRTVADDPEYRIGLTSLDIPLDVRWTVCETCRTAYEPIAFSPGGIYVAGSSPRPGRWVWTKTVHDGKTTSSWHFNLRVHALRWESNATVLIDVARPDGRHALVRCAVDLTCSRSTGWEPGTIFQ